MIVFVKRKYSKLIALLVEWFHATQNKRSEPQLIAVITILSKMERFSGTAESTLCANRPSADDHQAIGFGSTS